MGSSGEAASGRPAPGVSGGELEVGGIGSGACVAAKAIVERKSCSARELLAIIAGPPGMGVLDGWHGAGSKGSVEECLKPSVHCGGPPGLSCSGVHEHVVLLRVEELVALKRQVKPKSLQSDARGALECAIKFFGSRGCDNEGASYDLREVWPAWRQYIAHHDHAARIVGAGVVQVQAEQIRGVKDPNRYGELRVDIVIHTVDGGFCRLHPGSHQRRDAIPQYFPRGATAEPDGRAPQSACDLYVAPSGIFDRRKAEAIPQQDRLGRQQFLEVLAKAEVSCPCDVTECAEVPWRRWFCNLGRYAMDVIGPGIQSVRLEALAAEEAKAGSSRRISSATFHSESVDKCMWQVSIYQVTQCRTTLAVKQLEV